MKKTLIALAAVAATGAAFAQSSVTLYGVADASIVKTTDKSTVLSSSGVMNNGTSRWGVRGSEDLGGGLKAGFNFEDGLSLNTGASNLSGGNYFSRAAWMNLSGGFGELRLGRTLNPSFYSVAAWELTGTANYSAVMSQFGGVTGGVRNSSQVAYTTPNMGGFSATLGYIMKGNNIVGATAATATTPAVAGVERAKVDLNAIYRNGPVAVSLGYNKTQDQEKNVALGASYKVGPATIAGSVIDASGKGKGFTIGAGMQAGPVYLVVDVARDTDYKDTDLLLEAKYPLSKRTFAYAAFLRDGKGKTAMNVNNVGLGIRHNF
ncbi:porin [Hydrogenophaga sp. PAMC20947]|uniref:porin n=1 Tax=Hydrogenophaga sp. PAMC20947 TaxID=2565558 RepID=UPI00109DE763|nr:porin [Hydrogenophaga sp. PAMC20947]QCB46766.1 porin [Hydrogenophaga sp. PAMC20947]